MVKIKMITEDRDREIEGRIILSSPRCMPILTSQHTLHHVYNTKS